MDGVCRSCPDNTEYNAEYKICIKTITKVESPVCPRYATYNLARKECECPTDKPHNDGEKCFACFDSQFYDAETKQCLICPEATEYEV